MRYKLLFFIFLSFICLESYAQTIIPPGGLVASNITANSFKVDWIHNSSGVAYYRVLLNGSGYTTNYKYHTFYSLTPSTTYTVTVFAVYTNGQTSPASNSIQVKTSAAGAVENLVVSTDYTKTTVAELTSLQATRSIRLTPGFRYQAQGTKKLVAHIVSSSSSTLVNMEDINFVNDMDAFYKAEAVFTPIIPVTFYPNPVKDILTIKLGERYEQVKQIEVYSFFGSLVDKKPVSGSQERIEVNSYPPGMYILRIVYKDGTSESHKFVVSK